MSNVWEIVVWAVLWVFIGIEVAGIGFMILSGQPPYETDFDVVEADLVELRAQSARR